MKTHQDVVQLAGRKTPSGDELRAALDGINAMANEGIGEIAAMARMACLAFESPDTYAHYLNEMAIVLDSISNRASQLMNDIGCEAESVGCTSLTDAERRRGMAWRVWRESVRTEGGAV